MGGGKSFGTASDSARISRDVEVAFCRID